MFLAALLFYCNIYFILHVRTALLVLRGLTHLRTFYSALHKLIIIITSAKEDM